MKSSVPGAHKPVKFTALPGKTPVEEHTNGEVGNWWDCQVKKKHLPSFYPPPQKKNTHTQKQKPSKA